MEQKNIVATLYLKEGKAVRSMTDFTPVDDVYQLCQLYNDSGIDKIIIFDLSTSDDEHEKNINTIKNINRNIEIKVCAGGNINRLEDVKNFFMQDVCRSSSMRVNHQVLDLRKKRANVLAKIVFWFRSIMSILFSKINRVLKIHSTRFLCSMQIFWTLWKI